MITLFSDNAIPYFKNALQQQFEDLVITLYEVKLFDNKMFPPQMQGSSMLVGHWHQFSPALLCFLKTNSFFIRILCK